MLSAVEQRVLQSDAMMKNEGEEGDELAQPRARHVKKRALKNKALSVSFNEKDLRDYVTGFHKRKKKRRKEAEKQQEDAKRRKRIEDRKKRKEERDLVLYGGVVPADQPVGEQNDDHEDEGEEEKASAPISETMTYDSGNIKVTVTTSEVSHEEEIESTDMPQIATTQLFAKYKKHNLPITKKKSFKKVAKHKSRPKPRSKRDKKKGRKKK